MKKLAAAEAKKKEKVAMEVDDFKSKLVDMFTRETIGQEDIYQYDPDEREDALVRKAI